MKAGEGSDVDVPAIKAKLLSVDGEDTEKACPEPEGRALLQGHKYRARLPLPPKKW